MLFLSENLSKNILFLVQIRLSGIDFIEITKNSYQQRLASDCPTLNLSEFLILIVMGNFVSTVLKTETFNGNCSPRLMEFALC